MFSECPKIYDYYIFIDDDIKFRSLTSRSVPDELSYMLSKYKPLHASIVNDTWSDFTFNTDKDALVMLGGDLCVQIFHKSFVDHMFPTWIHGSGGSMHYAQWIIHMLYPGKSIYINSILVRTKGSSSRRNLGFL